MRGARKEPGRRTPREREGVVNKEEANNSAEGQDDSGKGCEGAAKEGRGYRESTSSREMAQGEGKTCGTEGCKRAGNSFGR